ncbi:MAG TPA: MFS transporter, partial [Sphingomicrobium sp.]|nr:MFS transporter [Sphingomicrobium sp.]
MGVRDVLRIRDYRHLFAGQVVSDIGDGITLLLVLLVINDLTGSNFAIALMAIAEAVPAFTVGLAAGVYVDRWNRRRIMLAADLLRAGIVLAFGLVQTGALVPLLYVLGFTQASIGTFFRPARGAMLPHIVPAEGLPAANSLAQGSQVIGGVIGSGIAGLLFGVFGSAPIGFAIDAATFLVSFAFISRIAASAGRISGEEHAAARGTGMLTSIRAGLAVVRGSRVLAGIIMASSVTMLGLGAVNVLFVPLVVNELDVSPTWIAGIDLAQTVGMLAAAALVTTLVRRLAPTTIITLA